MFLVSAPPKDLFTDFASESLKIKINQILFCKVNLVILKFRAFNCRVVTQLTSDDALISNSLSA